MEQPGDINLEASERIGAWMVVFICFTKERVWKGVFKDEYPGFLADGLAYDTVPNLPAAWVRRDSAGFDKLRSGDVL